MRLHGSARLRSTGIAFVLLCCCAGICAGTPAAESKVTEPGVLPGVVVTSLEAGSVGAKAGLLPGDIVLRWEREGGEGAIPSSGAIRNASVWASVELEEAPPGQLRLSGLRDGKPIAWEVKPSPWGIHTRPRVMDSIEKLGRDEAHAAELDKRGARLSAAWCFLAAAAAETRAEKQAELLDSAQVSAESAKDPTVLAAVWDARGLAAENAKNARLAREHYRRALTIREKSAGPLSQVKSLLDIAWISQLLGDSEEQERAATPALSRLEGSARTTAIAAVALNHLGLVAFDRGELSQAERYFQGTIAIREKIEPGSLNVAKVLNNLGLVALQRGALRAADEYHERALAIKEKNNAPQSSIATSLNNLGNVASDRGDLDRAEAFHLRALAIREGIDPAGMDTAKSLNNLGNLAVKRHEWDRAEELLTRSLALKEKLLPDSLDEASGWLNLGGLALERGDLAEAESRFEGYFALIRKLSPGSSYEAGALLNLAHVAEQRDNGVRTEELCREAIVIYEKAAPGCPDMAQALHILADSFAARGERTKAEETLQRALGILRQIAPESEEMAACLLSEARLLLAQGKGQEAIQRMGDAVAVHESCLGRMGGGSSARSGYAADTEECYQALLVALADQGRGREAFAVLERMRARELLRMLAQRDLIFAADIPAEMDERRRLLAAERDQAQSQLHELSPESDGEAIAQVRERLRKNGEARDRLREEILSASPRLAALQYPTPLDCEKALSALDPGTMALAYAVLPEETLLFALGPGPNEFSLHRIPVTAKAMAFQVRRFRHFVTESGGTSPDGSALGRTLLGPVTEKIAKAKRALMCPDGPLLVLPFSALPAPGAKRARKTLAQVVPLHSAVSVTVWEELKKNRAISGSLEFRVLAFADPTLPAALREQGLQPLPAARNEGEALTGLFKEKAAVYEGDGAIESLAKQAAPSFPFLHFACHGLLSGVSPLDASLVLASGGGENGMLQAWEIFEGLRLQSELAVLSACDTGVGQAQGGEGLVGLSRAFQYAGARSLLVSLWRVDDAATAAFMRRFYAHLMTGMAKDEALKATQNELARGEEGREAAHLEHWAAFQLVGDWR